MVQLKRLLHIRTDSGNILWKKPWDFKSHERSDRKKEGLAMRTWSLPGHTAGLGFSPSIHCIAPATTLMLSASTAMLKANASTPCTKVNRRMAREQTCTSDTCEVIPTT